MPTSEVGSLAARPLAAAPARSAPADSAEFGTVPGPSLNSTVGLVRRHNGRSSQARQTRLPNGTVCSVAADSQRCRIPSRVSSGAYPDAAARSVSRTLDELPELSASGRPQIGPSSRRSSVAKPSVPRANSTPRRLPARGVTASTEHPTAATGRTRPAATRRCRSGAASLSPALSFDDGIRARRSCGERPSRPAPLCDAAAVGPGGVSIGRRFGVQRHAQT
jgi:hypothetical protein